MPYVEGDTLRQRMEREGQLALDDAVGITTDGKRLCFTIAQQESDIWLMELTSK